MTYDDDDEVELDDESESSNDWTLCYLLSGKDSSGGFVGAILLTDDRVRPLYFAYVQPVRPTTYQRILYGSTLEEHVKIDVISQKLWQGLPQVPDVVFVDSVGTLAVKRLTDRVPVALLAEASTPQGDSETFSTLRFDTGPDQRGTSLVGRIVTSLESTCNLVEPFARLKDALKEALKSGG